MNRLNPVPQPSLTCPHCKYGKTTISVFVNGEPEKEMQITCVTCHGTGTVTARMMRDIEAEREMWCRCEEAGEPNFVPDGESETCGKHHYTCSRCGKILQIG